MSKYGLTFKNAHSWRDFGLIMQSADRSLLPGVKRQEVDIMSIPGVFDLQDEPVYANRQINVRFTCGAKSPQDIQAKKRQVAGWLTGRANLIFDDEPGLTWDAKVFEALALEQTFKTLAVSVIFECAPAATGNLVTMPLELGVNRITYNGNIKTPTLITIRNTGNTDVVNIQITAVERATGRGTV